MSHSFYLCTAKDDNDLHYARLRNFRVLYNTKQHKAGSKECRTAAVVVTFLTEAD